MKTIELCAMNCHHRFYELEAFFASAQQAGFQYVELWTAPQHYFIDYMQHDDIHKVQALAKHYGLQIIGICPEQTNPKPNNIAAKSSAQQDRVYQYFKNVIDIAAEINALQVVVTSGWSFYNEEVEEAFQRSVKMLKRLAQYAATKHMKLAIEALQKDESRLVNTVMDLKRLLDEVQEDALYVCLDFGAMAGAHNTIQEYFDCFHERIIHCHFVDGNPVGHMAWGDGSRNMLADIKALKDGGYQGYLSLETANINYYEEPHKADAQAMHKFQEIKKEMSL